MRLLVDPAFILIKRESTPRAYSEFLSGLVVPVVSCCSLIRVRDVSLTEDD